MKGMLVCPHLFNRSLSGNFLECDILDRAGKLPPGKVLFLLPLPVSLDRVDIVRVRFGGFGSFSLEVGKSSIGCHRDLETKVPHYVVATIRFEEWNGCDLGPIT
jgi:hypothetical protein